MPASIHSRFGSRLHLALCLLCALTLPGCPSVPGTDGGGTPTDGDGSGQPLPCEDVVLDVQIEGEGSVDQTSKCAQVTLTANAVDGWRFDGWFGSTSSKTNPITIVAGDGTTIGARFAPIPPDADLDGVPDSEDACPGFDDTLDEDHDGVPDDCDVCPGGDDADDADSDGKPDFCDTCPNDNPNDTDDDGVCESSDICPGFNDNADADDDGIPDGCDDCPNDAENDSDSDGVCGDVDDCPGTPLGTIVDEEGCPRPANNTCNQAFSVSDGLTDFSNERASTDGPATGSSCRNEPTRDVWYCYTATGDGRAVVDLCDGNGNFDNILVVYDGCTCPPTSARLLACGDDECCPGSPPCGAQVDFPVTQGKEYLLRIAGFHEETGTGTMDIERVECLVNAHCNDTNACTDDACVGNVCVNTNNTASCSDGQYCNGQEVCGGGTCQAGTAVNCDDGVDCTVDGCDEDNDSCVNTASDALCDDELFCNGIETCNPSAPNADPQDGCVPGTSPCMTGELCDDGTDSCYQCGDDEDCDDENPCTDDVCEARACSNPPNSAPCDDDDPCTIGDQCAGGICQSGAPRDCSSLSDDCNEGVCNGTTGACESRPANEGGSCDDGTFCNGLDFCLEGNCAEHEGDPCASRPECQNMCDEDADNCFSPLGTPCTDDGNVCTDNACDGQGQCVAMFNSAPCDDGALCNGDDTCGQGDCSIHSGNPCLGDTPFCAEGEEGPICRECLTRFDCDDDGITCTFTGCEDGACVHTPINGNCDDMDMCTTDTCDVQLGCLHEPVTCPPSMMCDPDTGDCVPIPCDTAEDCDDGIGCTVDTCNEGTGQCQNAPDDMLCDDGLFCTAVDRCDPPMGDPLTGCLSFGSPCPPGTECIEPDVCQGTPTNWESTQFLLPDMDPPGFVPPELYELDATGELIVAHLGLSQAELEADYGAADQVTVLATDVVPGQRTTLYRLFSDLGGGFTETIEQEITINTFRLDVTNQDGEFVAVWTFDYILARIVNGIFGVEQDVTQYTGSQRAMISPDGLTIMWDSVEGMEHSFLEQCDDGGESATCDVDCTFARCGDGVFNFTAGEFCEDGNTTPGDGCDGNCQLEGGFLPPPPPPTPPPTCGDGVIDGFDPVPLTEQTFPLGTWTVQDGP